jgi:hypothetical protein
MFFKNNIKISVSLFVIFMMMLHHGVPHAHHHHEDKEVVAHTGENDHHHHHEDGHQHHPDDYDKDKDADETGLSQHSEKHLHAFHVHEFVPSSKSRNYNSKINALPLLALITNSDDQPRAENKRTYRFALFRQIIYENPFLLSCSLRAPPYSA